MNNLMNKLMILFPILFTVLIILSIFEIDRKINVIKHFETTEVCGNVIESGDNKGKLYTEDYIKYYDYFKSPKYNMNDIPPSLGKRKCILLSEYDESEYLIMKFYLLIRTILTTLLVICVVGELMDIRKNYGNKR